jgi:hypothetical protein
MYCVGDLNFTQSSDVYIEGGLTVPLGLVVLNGGVSVTDRGLSIHNQFNPNTLIINSGGLVTDSSDCNADSSSLYQPYGPCVVYSPGTNMWGSTETVFSDERLKTEIVPLESSLTYVRALRGVYFEWRNGSDSGEGGGGGEGRHIGMIAQEVGEVVPDLVHVVDREGHLAVRYAEMLPLIVESLKELEAMVALREKEKKEKEGDALRPRNESCSCREEEGMRRRLVEMTSAVADLERQEQELLQLILQLEGQEAMSV